MSYSNIKRVLSAALLLAFASPTTLAYTTADISSPNYFSSAMTLNGNVHLTDNNEKITLSLRDSDVKQVLRMFADKAGYNIVFHQSVRGKVTLDLVDTPINEAFDLVLKVSNLSYYKQGNTMIVMSSKSPDNAMYSKQEMMVFPVKYVNADKIAEFLNKNVFSMKKAGMSGIDAATINSATNELIVFGMPSDAAIVKKVIEQFDREPVSKTFAVNHTTPAEMAKMICNLLLPSRGINGNNSEGSAGVDNSSNHENYAEGNMTGGAAGIMTGAAADAGESLESSGDGGSSTLKLGEGIVACTATASSGGALSPFNVQNLSIAYFPQRGTVTLMGGSEAQAKMVEQFIKANDIKQPQAMLEVSIVELDETGSKEFQNQWKFTVGDWSLNFDGTSTNIQRMASGHGGTLTKWVDYPWNSPDGSKKPYVDADGNVVVPQQVTREYWEGFPRAANISWQMNYLIQNRKGRVLANPKIMITNGQESVIDLTQDYVEKVTSEFLTTAVAGGGSSAGTVQKTYTIGDKLGIKVTLTPFISPEGYVTLNIKPNYSTIAEQIYTQGEVAGQSDLAATLLSRRDLDLKNIRIKDGETLVLGGMIQEVENKTVNKIPFLGDLPLIGTAFRSTVTAKQKNELIIMITPKIINDGENTVADNI